MARVLFNARMPSGDHVDVAVADGVVAAVGPVGSLEGEGTGIDLEGRLVLPALCEPHAHLDKALTADQVPNPAGDLMGAIEAWGARYHERTVDEVRERATHAAELCLSNGTTVMRTHVDVGDGIGTTALEALVDVRAALADRMDIELVALLTPPLCGPAGAANRAVLDTAIEMGVDLIGGCPHLEDDPGGLIDVVLDASAASGLPVDLHVDETLDPSMLSLDLLARAVLERGHPHAVTASHCVSLSMQHADVQHDVANRVAEAEIGVIALPQTNLFLQGRDHPTAPPRAITPIGVLREAGVAVAVGGDNLQDPFNPMGRGDPLESAALAVVASHELAPAAFELVSNGARTVLRRPLAGVEQGTVADLIAVRADGVRHAIAAAPADRLVFRAGALVSGDPDRF